MPTSKTTTATKPVAQTAVAAKLAPAVVKPAPVVTKPAAVAKPATTRATKSKPTANVAASLAIVEAAPEPVIAVVAAPAAKVPSTRAKMAKAAELRAKTARRASVLLKFVSDPTRLQVILFLAEAEHHVGALCEQLGQTQPAVSHHLALLRHGGIISPRRLGKNNFYTLSDSGSELAKVVKLLLQSA